MGAFALPVTGNIIQAAVPAATSGAAVGTSVALLSNPVTAIAGAALSIGLAIKNIFGANHAKAVANEATALNAAVPSVEKSIASTFDFLNRGLATPDQAVSALDTLVPSYNNLVYDQYKVKQKSGNGPDVVLKDWILPDVQKAEALIKSGSNGSFTLDAIPAHAGFAGAPSMQISWTKPLSASDPSGVLSTISSDVSQAVATLTGKTPATAAATSTSTTTIVLVVLGIFLVLRLLR